MKIVNSCIALIVVAVLLLPTVALAKMAVRFQQKVVFVQAQDTDGALRVDNNEIFQINKKEIRIKAATLVGKQARLLFFSMPEKLICVDIAPVTDPPFVINSPSLPKEGSRPL